MKITTLLENNAARADLTSAHGLSLYIETAEHKILFDMGPDEKFWDNAEKLGIDLAQVDIAFLSHAHSDHAGGAAYFLGRNDKAKLHLQKEEVAEVRWVTREEVLELLERDEFIAYPRSFLEFLFDMKDSFGFVTK